MVLHKEQQSKDKDLKRAQQIVNSAILAKENRVTKLWKEISKDMWKSIRERKKKHKIQKLRFAEISNFILRRSH